MATILSRGRWVNRIVLLYVSSDPETDTLHLVHLYVRNDISAFYSIKRYICIYIYAYIVISCSIDTVSNDWTKNLTVWYAINMQLSYFIVDVISFLIQDPKGTA